LNTYTHLFEDALDGLWENFERPGKSPASPEQISGVTDLKEKRRESGL
jgi:hypothetical protein